MVRSGGGNLGEWVERQLPNLREQGLWERSEWKPCFDLSFPLGTLDLDRGGFDELAVVVDRIRRIEATHVRIHHVADGVIDGNGGLESQQAAVIRQLLADEGIDGSTIDFDLIASRSSHVHAMRFTGR